MNSEIKGKVVKGLGGLYETRVVENGIPRRLVCRAKGVLKRDDEKITVGDDVVITEDPETPDAVVISEVLPRRNCLIRPPVANLDILFIVMAAKRPIPVLETVDKMVAIAEHNRIEPVVVLTKSDLDSSYAEEVEEIYKKAGLHTFVTSSDTGEGLDDFHSFVQQTVTNGATAAFAGASGVGKSTLINKLFPSLSLATSEISRKIERGRHTTRHVEIFEVGEGADCGFLADTPGFSLVDFARFDFFSLDDLHDAFRELRPYRGKCRYADCAHVGEGSEECAVAGAVERGELSSSRIESYRSIYRILKAKKSYE